MQCGQNVQLLNVKLLVHHVTSRLWKVNKNRESNKMFCTSYMCPFVKIELCMLIWITTVTLLNLLQWLAVKYIEKYKWVLQYTLLDTAHNQLKLGLVNWGTIITDFLLAVSLPTLKILQRDFEGNGFAVVYGSVVSHSVVTTLRGKMECREINGVIRSSVLPVWRAVWHFATQLKNPSSVVFTWVSSNCIFIRKIK
jgi:hypothetical protein